MSRAALVNRLRAVRSQSVATIVAPPGYGKSTLLAQWAGRDERSFVFATVGPDEGSAASLSALVAQALGLPKAGGKEKPWVWATAVPQLAAALRSAREPFVLVLDDAHHLEEDAAGVLATLAQDVPEGSLIAFAGRALPLHPLPRLRASGKLLELGADDLAFTRREVRALLQSLGVTLSEAELGDLLERTEGWPAGVLMAGLALRGPRPGHRTQAVEPVAELAGYVEAEYLSELSDEERDFARRTAVLDRLSGPLCDALLERSGSAQLLEALEASHVLVALDRGREWLRYRPAVGERLRSELAEREPWLVAELERRAAEWFEAHGDVEQALRHAWNAGDVDHVGRMLSAAAAALHNEGRADSMLPWIDRLEQATDMARHPGVAVLAARLHAARGQGAAADRCLAAAIRGTRKRDRRLAAQVDLVRAAMCADGAEAMLADTEAGLDHLPADDTWRPYGLLLQGVAHVLLGEVERADAILARAANAARRLGAVDTLVLALTQRALLATSEAERIRAGQLLDSARDDARASGTDAYPTSALTLAACSRLELLHGHSPEAFAALARARKLAGALGRTLPWLAVQSRLELAHAYVTLRDPAGARELLAELDDLLASGPKLGVLARSRDALALEVDELPSGAAGRSVGLTAAELRLVPMLATHLSFREIGARFFLSRNTVKTQAISVYRKLGASSRSEAVVLATSLGLIEPGGGETEGPVKAA